MKEDLDKLQVLRILMKELPYLRKKYGVERLALYGPFARGTQTEKSDVDILLQLGRPLRLDFVEFALHLERVLGRKVDVATFESLKRSLEKPRYKRIAADIQSTLKYV